MQRRQNQRNKRELSEITLVTAVNFHVKLITVVLIPTVSRLQFLALVIRYSASRCETVVIFDLKPAAFSRTSQRPVVFFSTEAHAAETK